MSMPAGWYDDGSGRQRWWDGEKWSEHFAPDQGNAAPSQQSLSPGALASAAPVGPSPVSAERVAPVLGFIGLALAVLGTILACIPATFVVGVVVLIAGFAVSLIGLFKKSAAKWPSIVGIILSIVGGAIGTVVTLVIVAASLAGPIVPATPTAVPSPTEQSSEPPVSPQPSDSQTGDADEGRPSPEEISTLYGQMFRDGGNTNYDDMPDFWPCMGQQLFDSDISDESLWLIIRGQDPLPAESVSAGEEIVAAGLVCDPNGEGAWG